MVAGTGASARDERPMMDRPMGVQLSDDYPCALVLSGHSSRRVE
jgi:hypothetical protein